MRNNSWTEPEVIKHIFNGSNCGGPVLYNEGPDKYCYTAEGHTIFLGISGAGKSRRGTIPLVRSLIDNNESVVVIDPKGEITANTIKHAERNKYDIKVINFRNINESIRYNPLYYPAVLRKSHSEYDRQLASELIQEFIDDVICGDKHRNVQDPFWNDSAKQLLNGTIDLLINMYPEEYVTISQALMLLTSYSLNSTQDLLLQLYNEYGDNSPVIKQKLMGFITASDRGTAPSILTSVIALCESFIKSPGLTGFLSGNDFYPDMIDPSKPTAIYIILPDETNCYNTIAGYLLTDISKFYLRKAYDTYGGKLPVRVNFILEELGNIGHSVPNLPHLMSAGRSRNIRVQFVLQSITQLTSIYSPSDSETILANADILIAYRINDLDTLRRLSAKLGQRFVVKPSGISITEDLITPADLGALALGQALVLISGRYKYIACLDDYSEMFDDTDPMYDLSRYNKKHKDVVEQAVRINDKLQEQFKPKKKLPKATLSDDVSSVMNVQLDSPNYNDLIRIIRILAYIRKNAGRRGDPYPVDFIPTIDSDEITGKHQAIRTPDTTKSVFHLTVPVPTYLLDWLISNKPNKANLTHLTDRKK